MCTKVDSTAQVVHVIIITVIGLCCQGKLALCGCNHRFVSAIKGKRLVAASEKVRENETLKVS